MQIKRANNGEHLIFTKAYQELVIYATEDGMFDIFFPLDDLIYSFEKINNLK